MQRVTERKVSGIELNGVISFVQTGERVSCVVYDVTPGCMEIDIDMFESRVCAGEDVELNIFLPVERTPVRCSGTIAQHPDDFSKDQNSCLAQIAVTHMSRMDHRRFELFTVHRRAFISGGRSQIAAF